MSFVSTFCFSIYYMYLLSTEYTTNSHARHNQNSQNITISHFCFYVYTESNCEYTICQHSLCILYCNPKKCTILSTFSMYSLFNVPICDMLVLYAIQLTKNIVKINVILPQYRDKVQGSVFLRIYRCMEHSQHSRYI